MSMALPGVRVGPLDPDATKDFGQVAAKNSARQLIRLHRQLHPAPLVQALARALDEPRTKALDLEEVRGYLSGLKHDNGDPLVPEGAEVVAAAVRGKSDSEQVLTFTYRVEPSKRTGKWFAPYDADELPNSAEAGDELSRIKELKDRGVVAYDSEGTQAEILRREAAALRRENQALRAHVEARDSGELPDEASGDTRADDQVVADNEQLGRENEELRQRVAQLEQLQASQAGGVPTAGISEVVPPQDTVASQDPPTEGYDELKADEAIKLIKDSDDATRERILAYERTHANRKSVTGAAEESLGARG